MFLLLLMRAPQCVKWLAAISFVWLRAVATLQVVTLAPLLVGLLLLPCFLFSGTPAKQPGLTESVRASSAGSIQLISDSNGSQEGSR